MNTVLHMRNRSLAVLCALPLSLVVVTGGGDEEAPVTDSSPDRTVTGIRVDISTGLEGVRGGPREAEVIRAHFVQCRTPGEGVVIDCLMRKVSIPRRSWRKRYVL